MADHRKFQDIADQITALIREGVFPPGSRLPGERELSERFGVSRVTIREAEIALQSQGKVKIRAGAGVYVAEDANSEGQKLPDVSAFELTEARSLFEPEAAALAASIITEPTLKKLDELLQAMAKDGPDDDEQSTEADREFHMTIAAASGNRAIIHVIETLWRLRLELPEVRKVHESVCKHDGRSRRAEHAKIVEGLRKRDPQLARKAMRQHFHRLLEEMLDANEKREIMELREKTAQSRARFLVSAKLG
jgi:GntR family hexuronate regulon transcriptional repressor